MSISIDRGVIPPFAAASGGVATVGWIVSAEDDETGRVETIGAAITLADAEALADAWAAAI
jgi:hypothetical protein